MTIRKAKASEYSTVKADSVENYIISYYNAIGELIHNDKNKRLRDCNKAQLNQIAAELETVKNGSNGLLTGGIKPCIQYT